MGCNHNFKYTQGHFYCAKCGKITQDYNYSPEEVSSTRKKKAGLVFLCLIVSFCALSAIGTVLVGSNNYLDVELSMLFYYGIFQDAIDKANTERIKEIIVNQDISKLNTYIDEKGAKVKDSVKVKRIENESLRLEETAKMEKEELDKKREVEREYELLIHAYTNEYRVTHELEPLRLSEDINKVARMHSQDMLDNDYFEHDNLKGQTPTDRGNLLGVPCVKDYGSYYTKGLGENIFHLEGYWVQDIRKNSKIMVDEWMESKGHRENILEEGYDQIGIGVRFDSSDIYATQNFC